MSRAVFWPTTSPDDDSNGSHELLDEAILAVRAADLKEVERLAKKVKDGAAEDPYARARALCFLGEVHALRGGTERNYRKSMDCYAEAEKLLEEPKVPGTYARAVRGVVNANLLLGFYDTAAREMTRAWTAYEEIREPQVKARARLECYLLECEIALEQGKVDRALEHWEHAGNAIYINTDPLLVGLTHYHGGRAHIKSAGQSDAEEARRAREYGIELLELAEDLFTAHRLPYYRARVQFERGRAMQRVSPPEAIELVEAALKVFTDIGAIHLRNAATEWLREAHRQLAPEVQEQPASAVLSEELIRSIEERHGLVLQSKAMRLTAEAALLAADSDTPVLITGATGAGKEEIAKLIHFYSRRAKARFVAINMAEIPEHLMETRLFGHERGAYTGADKASLGLIREADGGTLFLDEIGELPLALQGKLLRFLQEREVLPIGATRPVKVKVKVVAATHRDLEALIQAERFRADLFYRLNHIRIGIAPLSDPDRKEEIPALARRLVKRIAKERGIEGARLRPNAADALLEHSWPGNVRELYGTLQRALNKTRVLGEEEIREALAGSGTTTTQGAPALPSRTPEPHPRTPDMLTPDPERAAGARTPYSPAELVALLQRLADMEVQPGAEILPQGLNLIDVVNQFERILIGHAKRSGRFSVKRAADLLGLSLQRLSYRLKHVHKSDAE